MTTGEYYDKAMEKIFRIVADGGAESHTMAAAESVTVVIERPYRAALRIKLYPDGTWRLEE